MRKQTIPARRGATAIIAMLYLVLFSSMAIGFVAATTTAVQVAYNEDSAQRAMLAAESGMEFVRFSLYQMTIDKDTPEDELLQAVYDQLKRMMDGSPNLSGGSIALVNGRILIPGDPAQYVSVNDAGGVAKFRAMIEMNPDALDPNAAEGEPTDLRTDLRVWVAGYHKKSTGAARGVRLDYKIQSKPSDILKYGVASRGPIEMKSNAHITGVAGEAAFGSVLTTTTMNPAIDMAGNAGVSGDIAITNPNGQFRYASNSTVATYPAGSAEGQEHVHIGIEAPQFPYVDTSVFEPFATNVLNTPGATYKGYHSNIRIAANTNPSFDSSSVIEGVIYIEAPNKVKFANSITITGAVVVQNDPPGDVSNNTIEFSSNSVINGVESLVGPQWAALRELRGAAIIAPNFNVMIASNFGSVGGMIVAGQITLASNADGTVIGGFMSLSDDAPVTFSSNSDIFVKTRIASDTPAGLYFDKNYAPKQETYEEYSP